MAIVVISITAGCSAETTTIAEPVTTSSTTDPSTAAPTAPLAPTAPPSPTAPVESGGDVVAEERSPDDVLAVFEAYRSALLRTDGAAARDLVTPSTFDYYDRILASGLSATADDLLGPIPLSEALGVLAMRARLGTDLVAVEDGTALFELGVDEGLVGDSVGSVQFDRVDIDGDEAFGVVQGQPVMRFEYAEGSWLLDLPFTTSFVDDNEDVLLSELGGSQNRGELFDVVALGYGTTWADLSTPVG